MNPSPNRERNFDMPLIINAPVVVGSLDWPTKGAANLANNQ
jgi:hypothetical protein